MTARHILIIEDDPDINALLARIVTEAGYRAEQAFSGTEAQLRIAQSEPDLILLDLMIPGISGEALIAHVRQDLKLDMPILVISAKASLPDKVETISAGADDYLTKPFEPEEALVRIQAALRRYGGAADGRDGGRFAFKDLSLDVASRRVVLKGKEVVLTNHEFDILLTLIQAPDTVFSRERLYELVWNSGYYGEDNTINVHVSNIRKKLSAIEPDAEYIKTVWGIGFKLA